MKNSAIDIPNELDGFGLFDIDSAKELCLNSILLDNFEKHQAASCFEENNVTPSCPDAILCLLRYFLALHTLNSPHIWDVFHAFDHGRDILTKIINVPTT